MEKINSFWICGNTYAIIDSSYSVLAIGSEQEMIDKKNKINELEDYGPVEIVKLTNDTSEFFSIKY